MQRITPGIGYTLGPVEEALQRGPQRGYSMEPIKSILIVAPRNLARAEEFFCRMGVKIVTGSRYLGVFVGDRSTETIWLEEEVQG